MSKLKLTNKEKYEIRTLAPKLTKFVKPKSMSVSRICFCFASYQADRGHRIAVKNSVTIEKTLKSQNCNEMLKNDYTNKKLIVQIDH